VLPAQLAEAKALRLEAIALSEGSNQREFDHAVETVGGPVAALAIASVKDGGSVAGTAGFPEGANGEGRVTITNVMSGDNAAMLQKIADAAGRGELRLQIAQAFQLEQLAQAYDLLATRPDGKVIIQH
jgi:NADPH:quinone reductase-like Zn-dependent oxidoreductase